MTNFNPESRREIIESMPPSGKVYIEFLDAELDQINTEKPFIIEFPSPGDLAVEHLQVLAENFELDKDGLNATVGPILDGEDIRFGIRLASEEVEFTIG